MSCCYEDHEHDYCCRCYDEDDRTQRIIEDVLDGSYEGEITIPRIPFLDPADARSIARALVGVMQHEDVI